jgi:hypothetical protein
MNRDPPPLQALPPILIQARWGGGLPDPDELANARDRPSPRREPGFFFRSKRVPSIALVRFITRPFQSVKCFSDASNRKWSLLRRCAEEVVNGATACTLYCELGSAQSNEDRSVSRAGDKERFAAIRSNVDRIRQPERMVCDLHDAQLFDRRHHVGDLAVEQWNNVGVPDVNLVEGVFGRRDEDGVPCGR